MEIASRSRARDAVVDFIVFIDPFQSWVSAGSVCRKHARMVLEFAGSSDTARGEASWRWSDCEVARPIDEADVLED